jgi:hypothetical protein
MMPRFVAAVIREPGTQCAVDGGHRGQNRERGSFAGAITARGLGARRPRSGRSCYGFPVRAADAFSRNSDTSR